MIVIMSIYNGPSLFNMFPKDMSKENTKYPDFMKFYYRMKVYELCFMSMRMNFLHNALIKK
jgi:hypothetical protein